jgi:cytidylate kinase
MAVITISREYGSGATEIAARICERLGYRYIDKLLMTQMAAEVGILGNELADFSQEDYKVRRFLQELVSPGPHSVAHGTIRSRDASGAETVSPVQLNWRRAARLVQTAILAAHEGGNVVIMGRGGQVTLKDQPDVFHMRVVAPMADRILRIQQREDLGPDEARAAADREDRISAGFIRRVFDARWDDPMLYHMIINTGKWDVEDAAEIVVCSVVRMMEERAAA